MTTPTQLQPESQTAPITTATTAPLAASPEPRPGLPANALRLLVVALGLGLWANVLFIKQPLGLSGPLFALAGLLALFGLAALERLRPAWRNIWLAVPLLYFAVMVAVRADGFVTFLNVCGVLLLSGLVAHLFTRGNVFALGALDYLLQGVVAGFEIGLLRPIQALEQSWRSSRPASNIPPRVPAILRGLALALPVLLVFTILLTSADAAFNQFVLDLLKALSLDNAAELFWRSMFTVMVAWGCLGGLAYAFRAYQAPAVAIPAVKTPQGLLGFTEAAIVLGSVNLLFAAFVLVQFRYFFGGQSNITVAGFTYSDYARRGFGELVVVAVFTLGLGLALQTLTRRPSAGAVWSFNSLAALLVVLTSIILASAFQRLLLYEEAYGFTQLRTYPHVFMVWVGLLLGVFLITVLVERPRLFVFGVLVAGLGFVATLDLLDTDAFIAQQNIARYRQTGKLDAAYLATLSDDAVPALLPLLDAAAPAEREIIGGALHFRLDELDKLQKTSGWPGWHWARTQAHQQLNARRIELERYEPRRNGGGMPID